MPGGIEPGWTSRTVGMWVLGILAGVIAIVVANGINSISERMDTFARNQSQIQNDISWIRLSIADIYTEEDADEAHKAIKRTIAGVNRSIQDLYNLSDGFDARLDKLEKQVE